MDTLNESQPQGIHHSVIGKTTYEYSKPIKPCQLEKCLFNPDEVINLCSTAFPNHYIVEIGAK